MASLKAQLENPVEIKVQLERYVGVLNKYNSIKDTAQLLIGKMGNLEGKTVKSYYEELGLDIEDWGVVVERNVYGIS